MGCGSSTAKARSHRVPLKRHQQHHSDFSSVAETDTSAPQPAPPLPARVPTPTSPPKHNIESDAEVRFMRRSVSCTTPRNASLGGPFPRMGSDAAIRHSSEPALSRRDSLVEDFATELRRHSLRHFAPAAAVVQHSPRNEVDLSNDFAFDDPFAMNETDSRLPIELHTPSGVLSQNSALFGPGVTSFDASPRRRSTAVTPHGSAGVLSGSRAVSSRRLPHSSSAGVAAVHHPLHGPLAPTASADESDDEPVAYS